MESTDLLGALKSAIVVCSGDEGSVAVAYSGGLDSSLVAKLASERTTVTCYVCATPESPDARNVQGYAQSDGFRLETIVLREDLLRVMVSKAAEVLGSSDPGRIAYTIPTMIVVEKCKERVVLAGNGADELFAGYEKYALHPESREREMEKDLAKSIDETMSLKRFAGTLRKDVCFPFLAERVMEVARLVPLDQKIAGKTRKAILRQVGLTISLAAAERPKKAAQYSSGTLKMMRDLAKRDGETLTRWVGNLMASGGGQ